MRNFGIKNLTYLSRNCILSCGGNFDPPGTPGSGVARNRQCCAESMRSWFSVVVKKMSTCLAQLTADVVGCILCCFKKQLSSDYCMSSRIILADVLEEKSNALFCRSYDEEKLSDAVLKQCNTHSGILHVGTTPDAPVSCFSSLQSDPCNFVFYKLFFGFLKLCFWPKFCIFVYIVKQSQTYEKWIITSVDFC